MSSPKRGKYEFNFLKGLPPIETISHGQPNNSPSTHPHPINCKYKEDHHFYRYITSTVAQPEVQNLISESATISYVPKTEEMEELEEHPFMLEKKDANLTLTDAEITTVKTNLITALRLRQIYCATAHHGVFPVLSQLLAQHYGGVECEDKSKNPENSGEDLLFKMKNGIIHLYENNDALEAESAKNLGTPSMEEFVSHVNYLACICASNITKVYCEDRLVSSSDVYASHIEKFYHEEEDDIRKYAERKGFDSLIKADTHLHAGACSPRSQLLEVMVDALKTDGGVEVASQTLLEMVTTALDKPNLDPVKMRVEDLNMFADKQLKRDFNLFNTKLEPNGSAVLKHIFLKPINEFDGKYFAKLLKKFFNDVKEDRTYRVELRLTASGSSRDELSKIAKWWCANDLKDDCATWILQIPRQFSRLKAAGKVSSFQDMLENVFLPMFNSTKSPDSDPDLDKFLSNVVGLDLVDNEEIAEAPFFKDDVTKPDAWISNEPQYLYYMYYAYVNMAHLNYYRKVKGKNTIVLRPHCGEAGSLHHLIGGFLMGESICHGLKLDKSPVLQQLYFLSQIGISMSPTSNNFLFRSYHKQPLRILLERGFCVCVSSDDPLLFCDSKRPLLEEIDMARKVWLLSQTERAELCFNGILISGFPYKEKVEWSGLIHNYRTKNEDEDYMLPTARLNFRMNNQLFPEYEKLFKSGTPSKSDLSAESV